jgi:DeoR family glycerol-3-phosphate regulon repressor
VAQAIIDSARSTILVADTMKFRRTAPFRIGDIADINYLVTDSDPPSRFASQCKSEDVEIVIAR